jgi:hypothetical protein
MIYFQFDEIVATKEIKQVVLSTIRDPGSGMEKSDSGINIPDPGSATLIKIKLAFLLFGVMKTNRLATLRNRNS